MAYIEYAQILATVLSDKYGREVNIVDAIDILQKSGKTFDEWIEIVDEGRKLGIL